jgi:hypothetical protein
MLSSKLGTQAGAMAIRLVTVSGRIIVLAGVGLTQKAQKRPKRLQLPLPKFTQVSFSGDAILNEARVTLSRPL